jgi:hypothetical protein
MNTKQKTNWWIDLVLFAGFITTFFLDLTGVAAHQWIGIFIGALAAYHLFLHLNWVEAVSKRFFGKTSGQARVYYALDALLLLGFATIAITGLGISTWLNLNLSNFTTWLNVHITSSITTLLLLLLKLALHWRWIARIARNIWVKPVLDPAKNAVLQPAKVNLSRMERRQFLQVMGVVGVASFVALVNASKVLAENTAIPEDNTSTGDAATLTASNTANTSGSSSSSNSNCTVQCRKNCAYPGHCHRYVDTNNSGRCDLSECIS